MGMNVPRKWVRALPDTTCQCSWWMEEIDGSIWYMYRADHRNLDPGNLEPGNLEPWFSWFSWFSWVGRSRSNLSSFWVLTLFYFNFFLLFLICYSLFDIFVGGGIRRGRKWAWMAFDCVLQRRRNCDRSSWTWPRLLNFDQLFSFISHAHSSLAIKNHHH